MDVPPPPPDPPLPTDVGELQALVRGLLAEVAKLRAENAELRGKLDATLKHRFGRRSERGRTRRDPEPGADPDPEPATGGHGRSPLPEHLPRRTVEHDLSAAERACPGCGHERVCIGVQTAEQLDYDPATYFVLRTLRRVYACRRCDPAAVPADERITTAGPSRVGPVPKGLCGSGLLAFVVASKFADHLPLHRLAGMIGRSGVALAPATLGDWVAAAAELLTPLRGLMHRRVLLSRAIHTDDTPVPFREPGKDRVRRGHLWVYLGDAANPYAVFDFTPGYSRDGPTAFLAGYTGYVQADALRQYADVYAARATHACCWAHARRKFVAAADAGEKLADEALGLIRRLYHVERSLPAFGSSRGAEAVRHARRQAEAVPVLAELRGWLTRHQPGVLPKTPLGQAIGYAVANWDALGRYTEAGYLTIDNNRSERALRQVALGRNNWGVAGSVAGGRRAATLYSIVATCRQLGIDPFAYLRSALPGLFELGDQPSDADLAAWLPDVWLARWSGPATALAG
jgi:transposase